MRTTLAIALALVTLVSTDAFAQAPPPREPLRPLRGIVTSAADARPLPRATVIVAARGREYGPVTSDGQGRFDVQVPDGADVSVTGRKAGFAPAVVTLAAGARVGDVRIALERGAAVNGRILDPRGYPVAGLRVRVTRLDSLATVEASESLTETNDLGEFRAGALAAGRYAITFDPASVFRSAFLSPFAFSAGAGPAPADAQASRETRALVELRSGQEAAVEFVHDVARAAAEYVATFDRSTRPASPATVGSGPAPGGAVIDGRILDPGGRPVAGALVRVMPNPSGPAIGSSRMAASDAEGRYEVRGLSAGAFLVSAGRSGFIEAWHAQEETRPGGALVPLREGERRRDIDITLSRGSAVSGMIADEFGEPSEGLTVQLLEPAPAARAVGPAIGVVAQKTDDRGRYRLYGARPGSYYVRATGAFPLASALPADRGRDVYYPGRDALADALRVPVSAGFDIAGIDLAFAPGPVARVRGMVTDSRGQPFQGTVTLSVSRRSRAPIPPPLRTRAADGAFAFVSVPPGE
jgi:protocatechuate 3,4-dioxygenase beta subunit